MKTKEQIEKDMDAAEVEIKAVLEKYKLQLGMLYDEGVAITLYCIQTHSNGDRSLFEREADL